MSFKWTNIYLSSFLDKGVIMLMQKSILTESAFIKQIHACQFPSSLSFVLNWFSVLLCYFDIHNCQPTTFCVLYKPLSLIQSLEINSLEINSHEINSHEINFPKCQCKQYCDIPNCYLVHIGTLHKQVVPYYSLKFQLNQNVFQYRCYDD